MTSTTSRRIRLLLLALILLALLLFGAAQIVEQIVLSILIFGSLLFSYWKKPFSVNYVVLISLGFALAFLYLLIIPIPIDVHDIVLSHYSIFRNPILQHLNIESYPLALRPGQHLHGINWLLALFFFSLLCSQYFHRIRRFKQGSIGLIGIALGYCLLGWLQRLSNAQSIYWISDYPSFTRDSFFGTLVNPNHAGVFLAVCLPLTFNLRHFWKWVTPSMLIVGIITTGSRSAILSMLCGIFIWGMLQRNRSKRWFQSIVLLTFLGVISFLWWQFSMIPVSEIDIHNFTAQRSYIWKDSWKMIPLSPYLGIGMGGFIDAFPLTKSLPYYQTTSHAHQELLETWILFGLFIGTAIIVGILSFFLYALNILRNTDNPIRYKWRSSALAGCLSIIPSSLVDFPFRISALTLILLFLASPFTAGLIHSKQRSRAIIAVMGLFALGTSWIIYQSTIPHSYYGLPSNSSQKTAVDSLYSAPLNVYNMQRYLQDNPPNTELLADNLTSYSPTNAFSWVIYARNQHQQHNYSDACRGWYEALQLHFGQKNDPYISEALTCSPNLLEAMMAIPDDSNTLAKAGFILHRQKAVQSANYLLSKAAEIDSFGQEKYARFLVKQQQYRLAWEIIRDLPTSNCILAKTKAQIGFQLYFIETPQLYQHTIQHCGTTPTYSNKLLLSRLRNAEAKAITELQHDRAYELLDATSFDLFIHALSIQQPDQVCEYIRQRYVHSKIQQFSKEDIQSCSSGIIPHRYPLQQTTSGNDLPPLSSAN